jgi:glycosyltransferase involved in cell wall biosynthesis
MSDSFCIVTPNLNMGRYLATTIESVLQNIRSNDQYFVIDGGSSDESIEILKYYTHRITGWISEPDAGYAHAIAKGLSRCTSAYQCWVNSGDLLMTGALDKARKRLRDTGADMIFGNDVYIDESGYVLQSSSGYVKNLALMMLYGGWTPLQEACFWRHSLYSKSGGIDPSLRFAADYDLFLRFSLQGRCEYVPVIFGAFRRHRGQKSRHVDSYRKERELCRSRELVRHDLDWKRRCVMAYYWLAVRWRARVWGARCAGPPSGTNVEESLFNRVDTWAKGM